MPRLVDTSIRVLSQEPLATAMPTAELLRLAEILDGAGYAYLEVSGGGAFDAAVRKGVESPWERIRAIKARTKTPLMLAVRGGFLVGSRPVGDDLVRRFMASAAASGIDVFRLHDPLNDAGNLQVAAEAVIAAGREFDAGLLYGSSRRESLAEAARKLPEMGAARIVLDDPAGLLQPHRAGELVAELRELSGLPVGLYCQGAGRNGLALGLEAARAGVDVIGCAVYPVALATHRVSAESLAQALAGIGHDPGVDVEKIWEAADLVDEHVGDMPISPLLPRVSVRAARRKLPPGLVSVIDAQLRSSGHSDRLDEVLDEVERVRTEVGSPPLAAPMGQIVGSQALVNVLAANRYATIIDEVRDLVLGRFGHTPGPIDLALQRAVELLGHDAPPEPVDIDALRLRAQGLAASEEELLLLALFGDEAEPLLQSIRSRARGSDSIGDVGAAHERDEQIRSVVRMVQESGLAEITVEEDGVRITARRSVAAPVSELRHAEPAELDAPARARPNGGFVTVESPMVGTFYRSSGPGVAPFVEEGDPVSPGQVLCILEAMKLMNEVKAEIEAIVRRIHVSDAEPVEYGQLLFELEPLNGRPVGI
ncbi:MAG TPA: biotin/lipoyl-containing protein [Gaiellaceae bacterium]|nr:biotin/lipoyl-containing protein [Gaiellaceae bacterium]